jgi:hypothetical protein
MRSGSINKGGSELRRSKFSATWIVLGITAMVTGLEFFYPQILSALRRNPTALTHREWWRLTVGAATIPKPACAGWFLADEGRLCNRHCEFICPELVIK